MSVRSQGCAVKPVSTLKEASSVLVWMDMNWNLIGEDARLKVRPEF